MARGPSVGPSRSQLARPTGAFSVGGERDHGEAFLAPRRRDDCRGVISSNDAGRFRRSRARGNPGISAASPGPPLSRYGMHTSPTRAERPRILPLRPQGRRGSGRGGGCQSARQLPPHPPSASRRAPPSPPSRRRGTNLRDFHKQIDMCAYPRALAGATMGDCAIGSQPLSWGKRPPGKRKGIAG